MATRIPNSKARSLVVQRTPPSRCRLVAAVVGQAITHSTEPEALQGVGWGTNQAIMLLRHSQAATHKHSLVPDILLVRLAFLLVVVAVPIHQAAAIRLDRLVIHLDRLVIHLDRLAILLDRLVTLLDRLAILHQVGLVKQLMAAIHLDKLAIHLDKQVTHLDRLAIHQLVHHLVAGRYSDSAEYYAVYFC